MDQKLDAVLKQINHLSDEIKELSKNLAVNNHVLEAHHQRSLTIERKLEPIEDDYKYRRRFHGLIMGSSGIIVLISLALNVLMVFKKP